MTSNDKLKKLLLEEFMDESGKKIVVDGLDLSDFDGNVYFENWTVQKRFSTRGLKAYHIDQSNQQAYEIGQFNQQARNIDQSFQQAEEIEQTNQQATYINQSYQQAGEIDQKYQQIVKMYHAFIKTED